MCETTRKNRGESISILLGNAEDDMVRMLFETDHAFSVSGANVNLFRVLTPPKIARIQGKTDYLKNWPRRMEDRIGWLNFIRRAGFRGLFNRGEKINVAEFESLGLLEVVDRPNYLLGKLVGFHQPLPQFIRDELNPDRTTANIALSHPPKLVVLNADKD